MKAHLDCIPCQLRQTLKILRMSTDDRDLQEQVLRDDVNHMAGIRWDCDPMTLMKHSYDRITQVTGNKDPYRDLKIESNDEVLQLYPELQQHIQQSDDALLTAFKLAVAGNIMDFGAMDSFNIEETIQHVLKSDFAKNDYQRFRASLQKASSLLLFADNAGEVVLDKLLLETILRQHPLERVTVVVKEQPILNDATMEDVDYIGLSALPNIEFRQVNTTNSDGNAIWMPKEAILWIQEHDLVISKGQANYESLSEYTGLYFLLIAKCPIVAEDTGTYHGALIFSYTS